MRAKLTPTAMNMASTHLYGQLFDFLRQYSRARDLRHLKALAWMVSALICSGQSAYPPGNRMYKGERPKHKVWSGDGDGFGQSAGAGQSDVSATRDDR